MIQELLGGAAGLVGGERKISIGGIVLEGSPSSSPSLSPSSSSTTSATSTTNTATTSSDHQNLRCPRCDSSNTKFCYYNNYNLTQPRHFCKTCRRYWTKGGALRNVPIGGGCRKNKNTTVSSPAGKASTGKVRATSSDTSKSNLGSGFDHELPSNQILWPSPQNSQLLAFLRATQNPNPSTNLISSGSIKEEGTGMIGSHMASESAVATGALNGRTLVLDPISHVPLGLCNSFWRNNQHQPLQHHQTHNIQQQHTFLLGEAQNTGIQELYQRLRSSANYFNDHSQTVRSNVTSSSSSIMEPAPVSGGELGYWNPTLSWSDLPSTHGAYP